MKIFITNNKVNTLAQKYVNLSMVHGQILDNPDETYLLQSIEISACEVQ